LAKIAHKILVLGIGFGGVEGLAPQLNQQILAADLLVGGQRHLANFAAFKGEKIAILNNIEKVIQQIQQFFLEKKQIVVLASGDPLYYGIGTRLRQVFTAEELEIIAAPTSFQLAFAALAEPWHDALFLSVHAHPLEKVILKIINFYHNPSGELSKIALLTDNQNTPAAISTALLAAKIAPATPCAICENLGLPNQRIVQTTLDQAANEVFAPLNVFILWLEKKQNLKKHPISPGLPDESFSTSANLITKREIRLLTLAELALQPGEILWDIGAGSGAVSIEAARSQPTATVFAVEKRPTVYAHLEENLRRFPLSNLYSTLTSAPEVCASWPNPNAIFIGGSGGKMQEIIELAQKRLHSHGRLVINLATLEHLALVHSLLPNAQITQIQVNKGVSIQALLRFEALNPIFIVTWRKDN